MTDRPAIKPLEWEAVALVDGWNWMTIARAETSFGRYTLDKHDKGFLRVMFGNQRIAHFDADRRVEAGAAAQSDLASRIRSCLLDKPEAVGGGGRVRLPPCGKSRLPRPYGLSQACEGMGMTERCKANPCCGEHYGKCEVPLPQDRSGLWFHNPPEYRDSYAVDRFSQAMKGKLSLKRLEGRGGWDRKEECSAEFLSKLLREHVEKGDPVDVANFCMMLHQRGERITPSPKTRDAAADTDAAQSELDRLRRELEEARRALRQMRCPRPCNHQPEDLDAGDCIDAGECGCIDSQYLAALREGEEGK